MFFFQFTNNDVTRDSTAHEIKTAVNSIRHLAPKHRLPTGSDTGYLKDRTLTLCGDGHLSAAETSSIASSNIFCPAASVY